MEKMVLGIAIGLSAHGLSGVKTVTASLKELSQMAAKTKTGIAGLQKELQAYDKNLSEIGSLQANNAALRSKLIGIGKIGAMLGGGKSVSLAIEYENAMADIKKVVEFTSKEQENLFAQQILHLSRDIPLAAAELAQITASGGQMGIAADQLMEFTEVVAKMKTAFDMSADDASRSMATIMNVYSLGIKEAKELGDAMNTVSNTVGVKARDVTEVMARIGGNAKVFGLTSEQAAALSSTFLSLGKSPQIAGTAINSMLSKLATADTQGKDFQDTLESIGLSAVDLKDMIQADAGAAIDIVLDSLAGVDKSEQLTVLKKLFGEGISDDMALLVGSLGQYRKALGSVADKTKYMGSMQREFDARSKTTGNSITKMKNAFSELGIGIGNAFLPLLNSMAKGIAFLIQRIVDFMNKYKTLSEIIIYGIGALMAVKTASIALAIAKNTLRIATLRSANASIFSRIAALAESGATTAGTAALIRKTAALKLASIRTLLFTNSVNFLKGSLMLASGGIQFMFGWIGSVIKAIRSWTIVQAALNIVMTLNPIGLIIAAIAAVIAIIAVCVTKFEWVKNVISGVWETIKFLFEWSPLGLLVKGVGAAIDWLAGKFEWIGAIGSKIGEWWGGIKSFLGFGGSEDIEVNKNINSNGVIDNVYEPDIAASGSYDMSGSYEGGGVNVNFNGDFLIGVGTDGKFDFKEFKKELVAAVKSSIEKERFNMQNRSLA
ncbi:MAG: phage tail tape measure protein [Campylobacteraceae bacterium]|jgi:TP901 family phage tail tape measure protein|nr:phage tail tape measure protein [Campylobacteraceae bacterium]